MPEGNVQGGLRPNEFGSFFNEFSPGDRQAFAESLNGLMSGYVEQAGVSSSNIRDNLRVLSVSQRGSGSDDTMAVDVSPGTAFLGQPPNIRLYSLRSLGNYRIAPNTSGNPRIDLIGVRMDATPFARYIGIVVIEGEPAASPLTPNITDRQNHEHYFVPLARIMVPSGATEITSSQIDDFRSYATYVRPRSGSAEADTGNLLVTFSNFRGTGVGTTFKEQDVVIASGAGYISSVDIEPGSPVHRAIAFQGGFISREAGQDGYQLIFKRDGNIIEDIFIPLRSDTSQSINILTNLGNNFARDGSISFFLDAINDRMYFDWDRIGAHTNARTDRSLTAELYNHVSLSAFNRGEPGTPGPRGAIGPASRSDIRGELLAQCSQLAQLDPSEKVHLGMQYRPNWTVTSAGSDFGISLANGGAELQVTNRLVIPDGMIGWIMENWRGGALISRAFMPLGPIIASGRAELVASDQHPPSRGVMQYLWAGRMPRLNSANWVSEMLIHYDDTSRDHEGRFSILHGRNRPEIQSLSTANPPINLRFYIATI